MSTTAAATLEQGRRIDYKRVFFMLLGIALFAGIYWSPPWPDAIAWPLTMFMVLLGWVMFRADTVGHAFTMYAGMFGAHGIALRPENITLIKPTEILFLVLGAAIVIAPKLEVRLRRVSWGPMAETVALSVISVIVMQARTESPFLYFQF